MTIDEVIKALERVKSEFEHKNNKAIFSHRLKMKGGMGYDSSIFETKGGYFLVGKVAVKIAEIEELK